LLLAGIVSKQQESTLNFSTSWFTPRTPIAISKNVPEASCDPIILILKSNHYRFIEYSEACEAILII
jgi:hypothetical protein